MPASSLVKYPTGESDPVPSPYVVKFSVEADDFLAAGEASMQIKDTLKMLGASSRICQRAAVITYEAEMNMVIHGGGGVLQASIDQEKIELLARDEGPGIPDVDLAMQEGFSTAPDHIREMGFGAGMGLPNIKRNADDLQIETAPGKGTTIKVVLFFSSPSEKDG